MARYRKLFRLRFTQTRDGEVDEEFAYHLAMRAAELETDGLSPEQARAEALAQFGDIDDARAFCRAEDDRRMQNHRWSLWIDNFRQDVTLALRVMKRQPSFAASSVLTLGTAIGIAASAYGILHAYLIRPLPYPEPDKLAHVIAGPSRQPVRNGPNLNVVDWSKADSVFAESVRWDLDGFTLAGGERPEYVDGAWVSAGYFRALGMRPAIGRGFAPEEYTTVSPVAIISDALWRRRFGADPSIIGRTIRAHSTDRPNDDEAVTIVGVMPPNVWHVTRFTEVLRPLAAPRIISMVRLKPGQSLKAAEDQLNAVVIPQLASVDPSWRMTLASVQEEYTYRVRPTLVALMSAAAFLLLIGGASVAGAQTARAAARSVEIRVRIALGSSRRRLVMQQLTESLTIATAAALVGAAITAIVLASVGATIGEQLGTGVPGGSERLSLSVGMLAAVVGTGAIVGAAFGLIPAVSTVGSSSSAGLGTQRGSTASTASPRLRRGLIVTQVAFTMMLLVGAALMVRTMVAIQSEPLGFEPDRVVKGSLLLPRGRYPDAPSRRAGVERLLTGLDATDGILASAVVSPHPFWGVINPTPVAIEGRAGSVEDAPSVVRYVISDGYFDVMRIPLLRGRGFGVQDDGTSTPSIVVSETLARNLWPGSDAIGRRLRLGGDSVWRTVVGIVGDTRETVEAQQVPDVYLPFDQVANSYLGVVARVGGDAKESVGLVQRAVGAVDDVFALSDVEPMIDVVLRERRQHRALATVLSAFGAFALAVAMLGLYATLSYIVSQRRREFAIRVAVGANQTSISGLVLREGTVLVALGVVFGAAISAWMTKLLSTRLYGVSAMDPTSFVSIALLLAAAALAAAAAPIRHATRVAPAEALRSE